MEELRSEAGEREYSVCTKEAKNAAKELKKANQESVLFFIASAIGFTS